MNKKTAQQVPQVERTILPSIGNLFNQGFGALSHLGLFAKILVLPILLMLLVFAGSVFLFTYLFPPALLVLGFIAIFAFTVLVIWSQLAAVYAVTCDYAVGARDAFLDTKKMILPYFWISILVSFVVIGGLFLFIGPGIFFAITLSFTIFALVVEGDKGLDALGKSFWYMKGLWGEVFVRLFVLWIVTMAFSGVFEGILYFVQDETINAALNGVFSFVVGLIVTPFSFAYLYGMYQAISTARDEMPSQHKRRLLFGFSIWGFVASVFVAAFISFLIYAKAAFGV